MEINNKYISTKAYQIIVSTLMKSSEKLLCEYVCCLFPSEISTCIYIYTHFCIAVYLKRVCIDHYFHCFFCKCEHQIKFKLIDK